MEKLFEIISSHIPEDKKADIKAQFDGELEKVLKASVDKRVNEEKRSLSDKYKVNLFEEDIEKAYKNNAFISKTKYEELSVKNEELLKQVEGLGKVHEEHENLQGLFNKEKELYESSIKLVGAGFNPDRLHLVKSEITGNAEEDLLTMKDKYPELFMEIKKGKVFPQEGGKTPKTPAELYIESERAKRTKQ